MKTRVRDHFLLPSEKIQKDSSNNPLFILILFCTWLLFSISGFLEFDWLLLWGFTSIIVWAILVFSYDRYIKTNNKIAFKQIDKQYDLIINIKNIEHSHKYSTFKTQTQQADKFVFTKRIQVKRNIMLLAWVAFFILFLYFHESLSWFTGAELISLIAFIWIYLSVPIFYSYMIFKYKQNQLRPQILFISSAPKKNYLYFRFIWKNNHTYIFY